MFAHLRQALGTEQLERVQRASVLVVGAGGVGCELLKDLALCGLNHIELVDLDTIDVSNLNRQFFFQREHVGHAKAEVAAEALRDLRPDQPRVVPHAKSVFDPEFHPKHIREQFDVVVNALDNVSARRHVNRLCLAAGVPMVESGSTGYAGQSAVIVGRETECYECTPKPTQKVYPVCTLRMTPSEPIHCIVWAKHLYNMLYGDGQGQNDAVDVGGGAVKTETKEAAIGLFDEVFCSAIERLWVEGKYYEAHGPNAKPVAICYTEAMKFKEPPADRGAGRARSGGHAEGPAPPAGPAQGSSPRPVDVTDLTESDGEDDLPLRTVTTMQGTGTSANGGATGRSGGGGGDTDSDDSSDIESLDGFGAACEPAPKRQRTEEPTPSAPEAACTAEQCLWTLRECAETFVQTASELGGRDAVEPFDKDDDLALDFVTAASNIRQWCFHIPPKSRFDVKAMAGNIIPAIATTNAMVAGLAALEVLKAVLASAGTEGRAGAVCHPQSEATGSSESACGIPPRVGEPEMEKMDPAVVQAWAHSRQTTYVRRQPTSTGCVLQPEDPRPPNPQCEACRHPYALVELDCSKTTVQAIVDDVIMAELKMKQPSVITVSEGMEIWNGAEVDAGMREFGRKTLDEAKCGNGHILVCEEEDEDDASVGPSVVLLVVSHRAQETGEPPFRLVHDQLA